jgi:glutaryl-CoA dehydrogenase
LITMELNRGDGSLGTFPGMARLDTLGAFALTEPTHGSDSVALEISARREGDHWVINGQKKWIGNGTLADVVVLWARDEDPAQVIENQCRGVLLQVGAGRSPVRGCRLWWRRNSSIRVRGYR